MPIRVICRATIAPEQQQAFEDAYLQVTARVCGTPGHIRDTLLRSAEDGTTYILFAEWENEQLFRAWADDPRHLVEAAPMLPFWADTFERHIFEVRSTMGAATASEVVNA